MHVIRILIELVVEQMDFDSMIHSVILSFLQKFITKEFRMPKLFLCEEFFIFDIWSTSSSGLKAMVIHAAAWIKVCN